MRRIILFKQTLRGQLAGGDSAYALTYVFSPREQKVKLVVGGPGAARVWLNGQHVLTAETRSGGAEEMQEVALAAGWNTVLVRTAGDGFALRFVGGEGLRLSLRKE